MNDPAIEQMDFYQPHLDRVSRSFAFCIRQLRDPLRERVALAYLLCRVLDTIEDAAHSDVEFKLQQIHAFNAFIRRRPSMRRISGWLSVPTQGLREEERELLEDAYILFADLHQMPPDEKRVLQTTILSMSNGMAYFLRRSDGNSLKLTSLTEVNRYCFFVAAVVGEMLSRLLALMNRDFQVDAGRLLRAHQFGLFLQKINLLKDQMEDEKVGRCLIPSRDELWASLESDMDGAFAYLLMIPLEEREYRLFCGWSLFIGLASIPWIRRSWARRFMEKIPRVVTEAIISEVSARIDDNESLRILYEERRSIATIADVSPTGSGAWGGSRDEFPEFGTLYHGYLSRQHLSRLGM